MTDMEKIADFFGPKENAKRYRESAAYYESLARAADRDGDSLDAAQCRGKAAEMRKKARRAEASMA